MVFCRTMLLCCLFLCVNCFAGSPQPVQPVGPYPRLNTIQFVLSAQKWVSTKTAKVTMVADANLQQDALEQLQPEVLTTLKKIAPDAHWRVTGYQRNQDQSGLESVHITVQARLMETSLARIRQQAKEKSKPGLKYRVQSIQYTPSEGDVEQVRNDLRQQLYAKIQQEISGLGKIYQEQTFYVHRIDFADGDVAPKIRYQKASQPTAMGLAAQGPSPMNVSDQMKMTASVVVASTIRVN